MSCWVINGVINTAYIYITYFLTVSTTNRKSEVIKCRLYYREISYYLKTFQMCLWMLPHPVLHRQLHGRTPQMCELRSLPRTIPPISLSIVVMKTELYLTKSGSANL